MEGQLGLSELSIRLWVSAVQGCPLSGVPRYTSMVTPKLTRTTRHNYVLLGIIVDQLPSTVHTH